MKSALRTVWFGRGPALWVCAALSALSFGCAVHPVNEQVAAPEFLPEAFSLDGGGVPADRWWETFGDANLNAMLEEAFQNNHDLKIAWARLDQFAANALASGSRLHPQLDFGADARGGEVESNNRSFSNNSYGFDFIASYEIDLWKRIRSQRDAAAFDAYASRETLESTALTISALVAEQWFRIIEQKAQLALLNDQLETSRTFLELNELRFSRGRATAVDVYQQRTQVAALVSQFPRLESNVDVFQNQLAVLLGSAPRRMSPDIPDEFPALPPLPDIGIPMDAMMNRPDIRSAQLSIVAADHRIASAIADRLPALRISAQTGFQASEPGEVFSSSLWNIVSGLTAPILDGSRRQAEVERARAVLMERAAVYEKTALIALQEIENALIQETKQHEQLEAKAHELDVSRKTLEESQARFLNGLSDYLPVLTALTTVQRLERETLSLRGDTYLFRVDLYQALGGGWMDALQHPRAAGKPVDENGDAE